MFHPYLLRSILAISCLTLVCLSIWLFACFIKIETPGEKTVNLGVNITSGRPNLLDEAMNSGMILSDCNYDRDDFKWLIVSVTMVLDFFERNLDELVIDAAIGTRSMEAQLKLFQAEHPNLPQALQTSLITLQFECKRLSEMIIDHQLMSSQLATVTRNLCWVNDVSLWESPSLGYWKLENEASMISVISNTTDTMERMESRDEVMYEEMWDKCIAEVFKCCVTDECSKLFMEEVYSKYSLTHQLFYFVFAEKKNCFSDERFKQKMNGRDASEVTHLMCKRVWDEANAIQESNFPVHYIDLLTEQVFVCSLVGYTQFLKRSWLEKILSWQSEVGCWLDPFSYSTEDYSNGRKRVKRADNLVQMGHKNCSVHFTAVSICAMAMHLRYFGDTCLKNY